jgi:hypothetical protein
MGPPCQDCGGTGIAHCCDGLTACNDPPEHNTPIRRSRAARISIDITEKKS